MENAPKRTKLTTALIGAASLVFGIVMFMHPTGTALFLVRALGWILVAVGAFTLIGYARAKEAASQLDFFVGLVECVFGALLIILPGMFVNWLVLIMGVFILMSGLSDLFEARVLSAMEAANAPAATTMAVFTIVFGLIVMIAPFAFVSIMFTIAGLGLVFNGVTELVVAWKMQG